VSTSTQPLLQPMYGRLQNEPHLPATQVGVAWSGGMQVVSQLPQCAVLLVRSTQEPSQFVVLPLHVVEHLPPRHTCVPVQGLPHVPQFAPSDVKSTHAPPQGE
jgi:hypothetical protein